MISRSFLSSWLTYSNNSYQIWVLNVSIYPIETWLNHLQRHMNGRGTRLRSGRRSVDLSPRAPLVGVQNWGLEFIGKPWESSTRWGRYWNMRGKPWGILWNLPLKSKKSSAWTGNVKHIIDEENQIHNHMWNMKDITYNDNIRPKHSTTICHVATTNKMMPGGNHFNAQKKCCLI